MWSMSAESGTDDIRIMNVFYTISGMNDYISSICISYKISIDKIKLLGCSI